MKIKNAVHRSFVIIMILLLSVAVGYVYSVLGHKSDLKNHPREYAEYVERYSAEYGIPEYIVYAVILEESGFKSNFLSDDGRVGLMQLSDEAFYRVSDMLGETNETGILYDPETNVKYGTYYLSYLYTESGRWKNVFAAYLTNTDVYNTWVNDKTNTDSNGNLIKIPDKDVSDKIDKIESSAELYKELYY